jgi:hypothetical protein
MNQQDIATVKGLLHFDENSRLFDTESTMLADLEFEVEHSEQCIEQSLNGLEKHKQISMSENIDLDGNQGRNLDIETEKLCAEDEIDKDTETDALNAIDMELKGEESVQDQGRSKETQEGKDEKENECNQTEEQNSHFEKFEEDKENIEDQQPTDSTINDTCNSSSRLEENEADDNAYSLMQYVKEHVAESQLLFPWKLKLESCTVDQLVFCYSRLDMTVQLGAEKLDQDVSSRQITSVNVQIISDRMYSQ